MLSEKVAAWLDRWLTVVGVLGFIATYLLPLLPSGPMRDALTVFSVICAALGHSLVGTPPDDAPPPPPASASDVPTEALNTL